MGSSSAPALEKLRSLNTSSPNFGDQLCDALREKEYLECVPRLGDRDAIWLIDYLDIALHGFETSGDPSRKCLRELRNVCGALGKLPSSYIPPTQALEISPEPFASGGFSDVYKATLNGSIVCIKRIKAYTSDPPEKALKAFCQEAIMWKRLEHPNIVPLLGVTISPCLQLASEWMSGGDLRKYMKGNQNADRLRLLLDVAQGLEYLHSCNVIHGDLKGPNIVVDISGDARITDFGLATVTVNPASIPSTSYHHGFTLQWTAPEILKEEKYSMEADIFSFAMVIIEVFTGEVPFKGRPKVFAALSILQGERPSRPVHPLLTDNLWSLTQRCWSQDPSLRPKAPEVLQTLLVPNIPVWKQQTTQDLNQDECISLITNIFSDRDQIMVVENLPEDDFQTFIDMVDEVLESLAPQIQERCLRYLSDVCGRHMLFPTLLKIPLCYDPTEDPVFRGGLTDWWKGKYQNQEVTVQVFKLWPGNNAVEAKKICCRKVVTWKTLRHPNVLPLLGVTMTENRFAIVSKWMVRENVREFIKANVNVDRLSLLKDVTRGLVYLHDKGIIHGDLNGMNVLIDDDGHACLTGFGLATIASTLPYAQPADTTIPWKSPELLFPVKFGLAESNPTKQSDYYALAMVMYEILSGRAPFAACWDFQVGFLALEGKRPERPQGDEGSLFTDELWEMLELCWRRGPYDRLSAEGVLTRLDELSARPAGDPHGGWADTFTGGVRHLFQLRTQNDT